VPARVARVPPAMRGVQAMLVRPDAYVAWAGADVARAAEVEAELSRWMRR